MKVTLISLDNWGFNQFIAKELERRGIKVCQINFYQLRYKYPSFFHKVFNFFAKLFFKYNIKKKFLEKKILEELNKNGHQDKILIIKGDFLNPDFIKKIRPYTDNLLGFFNDNYKRSPKIAKIYNEFDKAFSFEKDDVERFSFSFITNFIYKEELSSEETLKQEVFNISSSGKRDVVIQNIAKALDKINIKYKIVIVGKSEEHKDDTHILYTKKTMDLQEVEGLIAQSNVLLDVHRENQSGLTFRVFESMGFSKKLITTNKDIATYDFYNPNNILIVDKKNIEIPKSFFETPYEPIPKEIYDTYTLPLWVNKVFGF
ncbi:hypothetical protein D1818_07770 [Aquimarina sp. BL5]|uniref:hypothetical protein n=1 Tax=Aquimarina sp. BL5 TaxID=1714860 RepID=UPI000E5514D3|nr:hypothetical protein [Aquimarina sp. BL5]AXT50730.1 hypothetical protein D1818_07770 [Aquimarina sp. BL5]RKN08247.1 hypothetical protein D7036_06395 [Aquimarina sp. BL5]